MNAGGAAALRHIGPGRPSRVMMGVAGAALLAMSACASGGPSASGSGASEPSASVVPGTTLPASPTALPTSDGSPDEASRPAFQAETLATVVVNGLNVRVDHTTNANVAEWFGARVQLNAGEHVLVLGPPVWGDGRWWLEIATDGIRPDQPLYDPVAIVGFVAAGTLGEPWVEADDDWCPNGDPSLATFLDLSAVERLGCYGSTSLTISAYVAREVEGLGGMCEPSPPVPAWLICDGTNYNWVNRHGDTAWEFNLYFDPANGIQETGLAPAGPLHLLQVTGHFDDPAARDCAVTPETTDDETATWLNCRMHFVVDRVQ